MITTTFYPAKPLHADDRQQYSTSDKSLVPRLVDFCYLQGTISDEQANAFIPRYILSARSSCGMPCVDSHFFEHSLKQSNSGNPLCPDFGWTSDTTQGCCYSRFSTQAVTRKALPLREKTQKATIPSLVFTDTVE